MRIICLSILFLVVGCKNVEVRKVSEADIIREEMNQLDWENVDTYPDFEACRGRSSKEQQKRCVGEKLIGYIMKSLTTHEIILNDSIHEEIYLTIRISAQGKPEIETIKWSDELQEKVKGLEGWLQMAVD